MGTIDGDGLPEGLFNEFVDGTLDIENSPILREKIVIGDIRLKLNGDKFMGGVSFENLKGRVSLEIRQLFSSEQPRVFLEVWSPERDRGRHEVTLCFEKIDQNHIVFSGESMFLGSLRLKLLIKAL